MSPDYLQYCTKSTVYQSRICHRRIAKRESAVTKLIHNYVAQFSRRPSLNKSSSCCSHDNVNHRIVDHGKIWGWRAQSQHERRCVARSLLSQSQSRVTVALCCLVTYYPHASRTRDVTHVSRLPLTPPRLRCEIVNSGSSRLI